MTREQERLVKELCRRMENRLHHVQQFKHAPIDYEMLLQLTIADAQEAQAIVREALL